MDKLKSAAASALAMNRRGQVMKGRMIAVVGFILAFILLVGVGIPISQQVINDQNLTGLTGTIVGFTPPLLAVGSLVQAARVAMRS